MPGSKRKAATMQRSSHLDKVLSKKRARYHEDENTSSNIMAARDETTEVRRIKRGIEMKHKRGGNTAEMAKAGKDFFFGISGDKFTSKNRFTTDLAKISKSHENKMSSIFAQADLDFVGMLRDQEFLEEIEEFPVSLEALYENEYITQRELGRGVKITLEFENNKVRRNIDVSEEVLELEDNRYKKLHEEFQEIEQKYNRSSAEIADIFVKVSGDIVNLKRYLEGEDVPIWSYLEDLALTKPEDSMEYRCLLESKGKDEIDKRKKFLMDPDDMRFM